MTVSSEMLKAGRRAHEKYRERADAVNCCEKCPRSEEADESALKERKKDVEQRQSSGRALLKRAQDVIKRSIDQKNTTEVEAGSAMLDTASKTLETCDKELRDICAEISAFNRKKISKP